MGHSCVGIGQTDLLVATVCLPFHSTRRLASPADAVTGAALTHLATYVATIDPTRAARERARARSERTRGANPQISAHIGDGVYYQAPRIIPPVAQARESKSPNSLTAPRSLDAERIVYVARPGIAWWQRRCARHSSDRGVAVAAPSPIPSVATHAHNSIGVHGSDWAPTFRNLHLLDGHDLFGWSST